MMGPYGLAQVRRGVRGLWLTRCSLFEHALARRAAACLVLFALSAITILPHLGQPRAIVFDETYYITDAQKYLNGVFFLQTHPPLGKLLIAVGERWLHPDAPADEFIAVEKIETGWPPDVDIAGYRLMPALFGILNPILAFLILTWMVGQEWLAFAMALFITFDNALIVQARVAMLDSFLIFFCLASLLIFCYLMRKLVPRLRTFLLLAGLWGILQACAVNVKLTGAVVLVLVAVYAWRLWRARGYRRLALFGVVFVALFAITYLGLWQVHFAIARKVNPANDFGISETHWNILIGADRHDPLTQFAIQFKEGMEYSIKSGFHSGPLNYSDPGEIGSPWYWWPVGGRAIDYRWETPDRVHYAYVYLLGNPTTWAISLLGVIGGTVWTGRDLLLRFPQASRRRWLYSLVLLYWAYMVPTIVATRVTYLYHYLFPMILGVLLFGLMLSQTPLLSIHRRGIGLAVGILVLLAMFWILSPLTYSVPLTHGQFLQRNIIPTWHLKCGGC